MFCGLVLSDEELQRAAARREARNTAATSGWKVMPQRGGPGGQRARLQALHAARRTTQATAVRNPFALLSEPAAAASSASGARRGVGGNKGETVNMVSESSDETHTTHTHNTPHAQTVTATIA